MTKTSDIKLLRTNMVNCRQCHLSPQRCKNRKVVPSIGPPSSIVIIGEAPGRAEDESGEPFLGMAGKLLDKLLKEAKIKREQVYITNVVKCRPFNGNKNRKPTDSEILACDWLERELEIIRPVVVVPLGKTAFDAIYKTPKTYKLGDYVGKAIDEKWFTTGRKYSIIPCYHPSYLMQHGRAYVNDSIKALALAGEMVRNG